jgi:hypothetical protein
MYLAVLFSTLRLSHLFMFWRIYLICIASNIKIITQYVIGGNVEGTFIVWWRCYQVLLEGWSEESTKKMLWAEIGKWNFLIIKQKIWKAPSRLSVPACPESRISLQLSISRIIKRSRWYLQIDTFNPLNTKSVWFI